MDIVSLSQQFIVHFFRLERAEGSLSSQRHFVEKEVTEGLFQLMQFCGVGFAEKECVAFKTLVVSQDNITGLEFFYKIFVVSFQSFLNSLAYSAHGVLLC